VNLKIIKYFYLKLLVPEYIKDSSLRDEMMIRIAGM
jgi:hypothetical protein